MQSRTITDIHEPHQSHLWALGDWQKRRGCQDLVRTDHCRRCPLERRWVRYRFHGRRSTKLIAYYRGERGWNAPVEEPDCWGGTNP